MRHFYVSLRRDRRGATPLERGLVAAVIGVVMVAGVAQLGTGLNNVFSNVASLLQ